MNPFEYIKQRITDIADVNVAINGRDPSWGYADITQLLDNIEKDYNAKYGSSDVVYRSDAIGEIENYPHGCTWNVESMKDMTDRIKDLPSAQPENTKEYNLKKIYNIYVKIAQAHFLYQPSKPKTITAMPFDWIEVQNLLEKYLKDHGADFDALCMEYVSENVKDDHLLSAQPEPHWIPCSDPSDLPKDKRLWITREISDGFFTLREVSDVIWDMTEWSGSVSGVVAYMSYWEPEPYTERKEK